MDFKVVERDGKYFYEGSDGKLYGEGYDIARAFREGYAAVKKDGKFYFVDKDFNLHGEGYDEVWPFNEGYARVKKDGVEYRINKDFQIADESVALRLAELNLGMIKEIAPKSFLADGFSEALDEIIHKHYTQKIAETTSLGDALKIKEEVEELHKLIEDKKQEVSQEAKEVKQAKTDAQETLDKLFGNSAEKNE